MYTIIVTLVFIAFLLLYNLSKKAKWELKPNWAVKIQSNEKLGRSISFALMLVSLVALMLVAGVGSGIFMFLVILMTVGSCIVLLTPFQYFQAKHLALLFVLSIVFEFFIF